MRTAIERFLLMRLSNMHTIIFFEEVVKRFRKCKQKEVKDALDCFCKEGWLECFSKEDRIAYRKVT